MKRPGKKLVQKPPLGLSDFSRTPPEMRRTVSPLSHRCDDCDRLTTNGGACPGLADRADAERSRPCCHSETRKARGEVVS